MPKLPPDIPKGGPEPEGGRALERLREFERDRKPAPPTGKVPKTKASPVSGKRRKTDQRDKKGDL